MPSLETVPTSGTEPTTSSPGVTQQTTTSATSSDTQTTSAATTSSSGEPTVDSGTQATFQRNTLSTIISITTLYLFVSFVLR